MTNKIFFIILSLFLISCDKNKTQKNNIYEKYRGLKITEDISQNDIKYELIFPDTIQKGEIYDAILHFESDFDTIAEPMKDKLKHRIITFYYYEPVKYPLPKNGRNVTIQDSMFIPNKKFILGNIKFNESGEYLLSAAIKDEIMYSYYTDKHRDSVHFSRKTQDISKKVVVIE